MFYVYLHKKPNGEVFYVGKGTKNRAWSKHNRNPLWNAIVKKHGAFEVEIVLDNLQEWYAFELEYNLILQYGLKSEGGTLANISYGGGGNGQYVFTQEDRLKISEGTSGENNGRYNSTEYTFINLLTKDIYTGTLFNFQLQYGFTLKDLVYRNDIKTYRGWALKAYYDQNPDLRPYADTNPYEFTHSDGTTFTGTRAEFREKYNLDPKTLFKSEKYRNKSFKGWTVKLY